MVIILLGILTTHTNLSFLQPSNAVESIFVTEAGIVMRVKEVHSQKARKSMVVTVSGITISFSEMQP